MTEELDVLRGLVRRRERSRWWMLALQSECILDTLVVKVKH